MQPVPTLIESAHFDWIQALPNLHRGIYWFQLIPSNWNCLELASIWIKPSWISKEVATDSNWLQLVQTALYWISIDLNKPWPRLQPIATASNSHSDSTKLDRRLSPNQLHPVVTSLNSIGRQRNPPRLNQLQLVSTGFRRWLTKLKLVPTDPLVTCFSQFRLSNRYAHGFDPTLSTPCHIS